MEEFIQIGRPHNFADIAKEPLLAKLAEDPSSVQQYMESISGGAYLPWEKAKHKPPIPGLSAEQSWVLAKFMRKAGSTPIVVRDENSGKSFTWRRPDYTDELLRKIDMYSGGSFLSSNDGTAIEVTRQRFLARGIVEESIASSQLEGANTEHKYAKKMIAENIEPRNKSDQMILNNYEVLHKVDTEYKDSELSIEMLCEIQAELTNKTLDEKYEPGKLRKDTDNIVVKYGGKIAFEPPSQDFTKKELARLVNFANNNEQFIHPIIKAIILHFWIGFLHPFPDGNGRLARAIFYWHLLRNDYWAMAFLPIASVIKRAPAAYTFAYIYAEQDDLDFTYFFDYLIKRTAKAVDELYEYINKTSQENSAISAKLRSISAFNFRQEQVVHRLVSDPENYVTMSSHAKLNGITNKTAMADLRGLLNVGLAEVFRSGRSVKYYATDKLRGFFN